MTFTPRELPAPGSIDHQRLFLILLSGNCDHVAVTIGEFWRAIHDDITLNSIMRRAEACEVCGAPSERMTRFRDGRWQDGEGKPLPARYFCARHQHLVDEA